MTANYQINGREIGPESPTYIVAELSANHNQDFDLAVRTIRAAREAGADAIKLQTYTADTLTIDCDSEPFRIRGTLWNGRTLYDLYKEAYTPWEWHAPLKQIAKEEGLDFFSTPFDATAVDFLENLGVPVHKIASFENVDLPLIRKVAATGKPIIMSTGMASLGEIDEAVRTARQAGCEQLALLKCTSAYPAPAREMNLRTIPHLAEAFGAVIGLSDHSMGSAAAVAAVTLGARIVEKHFILSRSLEGADSAFSMEPGEFREMVNSIRMAEQALGEVSYSVTERELSSKVFRRSLFVVKDVRAGEPLTAENVRVIRPGHGLPPRHLDEVLGRRAACDIERGTPLSWALVG